MATDRPLTVGSVVFEDNYPKLWFSRDIRCFPTIVVSSQATTGNTLLQCGCPGPFDRGQATSFRLGSQPLRRSHPSAALRMSGGPFYRSGAFRSVASFGVFFVRAGMPL